MSPNIPLPIFPIDTNERLDADHSNVASNEGALIGIEIGRILNEEPIRILNKMSMDDEVMEASPLHAYTMGMVLTAKMSRSYGFHEPETIYTPNLLREFNSSMLTMINQSLCDFHNMCNGLAVAHELSLDDFADNFEVLAEKNIQFLVEDMIVIASTGNLVEDGTGVHTNLNQFNQRLHMFEAVYIVSGHANDPAYTSRMYDAIRKALLTPGESDDPRIVPLSIAYAEEVGKNDTNIEKLVSIRSEHPELAQAIIDRAALEIIIANSHGRMNHIQPNATKAQEVYRSAISAMSGADLTEVYKRYAVLMNRLEAYSQLVREGKVVKQEVDITTLDWEVLPAGELRNIAQDIVDKASVPGKPVTIELNRLTILDAIRASWGADRAYYARGKLGQRRIVRDGENESPDQYLLLILQEHDENGIVSAEHAIAESPIAGPHAMYIFRQDVSGGLSWREVMALGKGHARDLGARPVKHIPPSEDSTVGLIEAMSTKAELLMSCTPEEFRVAVFNGDRGIRIPRNIVTIG